LWQPKADLPYNYYPIFINTSEVFVKTHYTKLISQGQWLGGLLCGWLSGWIRNTFSENIKCIANEKAKRKTKTKKANEQRAI